MGWKTAACKDDIAMFTFASYKRMKFHQIYQIRIMNIIGNDDYDLDDQFSSGVCNLSKINSVCKVFIKN